MKKKLGFIFVLVLAYVFIFQSNELNILMEETDQQISNESGLKVVATTDLHSLSEYGMFTVVELYAESCHPCKLLKKKYDKFLPLRPDVAVRRIQLADNWTVEGASKKYSIYIRGTPHVLIFDKTGELLMHDDGRDKTAYITLQKWIHATLKKNI